MLKHSKPFWKTKYFINIMILIVIILSNTLHCYGAGTSYIDGNQYRKLPKEMRIVYILGVIDGISAANTCLLEKPDRVVSIFLDDIKGMQGGQLLTIIDKFISEHPEGWHYTMATSVIMAFIEIHERQGK